MSAPVGVNYSRYAISDKRVRKLDASNVLTEDAHDLSYIDAIKSS